MSAAAILDFKNFNSLTTRDKICVILSISSRSVDSLLKCDHFSIFQDSGCPPSWTRIWYSKCSVAQEVPARRTVSNFVKIGKTFAAISRFYCFQVGGRRHLGFSKIQFLNGIYAWQTKSVYTCLIWQDWKIQSRDMAIFRLFKMAVDCHVEFWKVRFLWFSTVQSTHALHHVKFGRNRTNICVDTAI